MASEERFFYRGTTLEWPGGGLRDLGITSVTTDPLVATLFAIECARQGKAVVHLVPQSAVLRFIVPSNCFTDLEREIGLAVTPEEFSERLSLGYLAVSEAYEALIEIGISELPIAISTYDRLQDHLKDLRDAAISGHQTYLTDEQIQQFDRIAVPNLIREEV